MFKSVFILVQLVSNWLLSHIISIMFTRGHDQFTILKDFYLYLMFFNYSGGLEIGLWSVFQSYRMKKKKPLRSYGNVTRPNGKPHGKPTFYKGKPTMPKKNWNRVMHQWSSKAFYHRKLLTVFVNVICTLAKSKAVNTKSNAVTETAVINSLQKEVFVLNIEFNLQTCCIIGLTIC